MSALDAKRRRIRWAQENRCGLCGGERDSKYICCTRCRAKMAITNRARYRRQHGIADDAPIRQVNGEAGGKWQDKPGECSRCSRPALPDSNLCDMHEQTMRELATERSD